MAAVAATDHPRHRRPDHPQGQKEEEEEGGGRAARHEVFITWGAEGAAPKGRRNKAWGFNPR